MDDLFRLSVQSDPRGVYTRLVLFAGPPEGVDASAVAQSMFEVWGQDKKIEPHMRWIRAWVERGLLPQIEQTYREMHSVPYPEPHPDLPWSREELEFGCDYAAMGYPGWMDDRAIRAARSRFSRPVPETEAEQEALFDGLISYFAMNPCGDGWARDINDHWFKRSGGSS